MILLHRTLYNQLSFGNKDQEMLVVEAPENLKE
jgi:hypothetical protein